MFLEHSYNVVIRYTFGDLGGQAEHTSRVSYQTVNLMMKSPFVTVGRSTIKVKTFEVTDLDTVIFYGEEVKRKPEREELSLEELIEWL